tara:strand:+ start:1241 stop:1423 length:183 start_codon:yes stop_codon:yes gene_type:complete
MSILKSILIRKKIYKVNGIATISGAISFIKKIKKPVMYLLFIIPKTNENNKYETVKYKDR